MFSGTLLPAGAGSQIVHVELQYGGMVATGNGEPLSVTSTDFAVLLNQPDNCSARTPLLEVGGSGVPVGAGVGVAVAPGVGVGVACAPGELLLPDVGVDGVSGTADPAPPQAETPSIRQKSNVAYQHVRSMLLLGEGIKRPIGLPQETRKTFENRFPTVKRLTPCRPACRQGSDIVKIAEHVRRPKERFAEIGSVLTV